MIAWNLLFLNQFVITSDSDCKVFFSSPTVFVEADLEGHQKLSFENHFIRHLYEDIDFGL